MTAVRRYTTAETNAAAQQLYLQEPPPQIMDELKASHIPSRQSVQ